MDKPIFVSRKSSSRTSAFGLFASSLPALIVVVLIGGLAAASASSCHAQAPASQANPAQQAPAQPAQADSGQQSQAPSTTSAPQTQTPAANEAQKLADARNPSTSASASGPAPSASDATLEAELRTLLVGKPLFLRGCYLSNDLRFNERGGLYDSSPRGSFTLSGIQIESLRLTRKELILEGDRYGYRFLGALPGNNPTDDMERIKITPKKKILRIRIEREEVVASRKDKEKPAKSQPGHPDAASSQNASAGAQTASASVTTAAAPAPASPATLDTAAPAQSAPNPADSSSAKNEPLKDEPTTTSPEYAVQRLKNAIARLFTPSLDDRFVGSLPAFWQLYYKGLAAKTDYRPSDPSVLRQSQVDKKASLISALDPPSNEFAQEYAVAGVAVYHVVVGPDGRATEIAIGQPIGFGLDENAVDTLKKATFEPAIKDGKPVSVVLDLIVQFHIYSKLTSGTSKPDKDAKPALPGPYSLPPKP
jgi:hypothetical protein